MSTVRTLAAALVLTATGVAQAAEYTDFPLEKSIRSRAEVQAEARNAPMTGESYDGTLFAMPTPALKNRDAVRMEARIAIRMTDAVTFNDQIGG